MANETDPNLEREILNTVLSEFEADEQKRARLMQEHASLDSALRKLDTQWVSTDLTNSLMERIAQEAVELRNRRGLMTAAVVTGMFGLSTLAVLAIMFFTRAFSTSWITAGLIAAQQISHAISHLSVQFWPLIVSLLILPVMASTFALRKFAHST